MLLKINGFLVFSTKTYQTQWFFKVLKGTTGLSRGSLEGPQGSSGASRVDHESATGFPREIHDNLLDLDMQFTAFA